MFEHYEDNIYLLKGKYTTSIFKTLSNNKVEETFGKDVVKNIYIEVNRIYDEEDTEEEIENIRFTEATLHNVDARDVYIEFVNGRIVKFTNSEWGSIERYIPEEDKLLF